MLTIVFTLLTVHFRWLLYHCLVTVPGCSANHTAIINHTTLIIGTE